MITAVDSSIILDILVDDINFADASESALRKANKEGKLIICECVAAEIFPAFNSNNIFMEFLNDWQLDFIPSSLESAELAGEYYKVHLKQGGSERVLPDFLIGAHAMLNADRLLSKESHLLCRWSFTCQGPWIYERLFFKFTRMGSGKTWIKK